MTQFTTTERKVIDALSKGGQMLASTLSRKTGVKRPTVYAVLNKLKTEGLVLTLLHKGSSYFKLLEPDLIKDVLSLEAKAQYNAKLHHIEILTETLKEKQIHQHEFISGFELSTVEKTETVYQELASAFKDNKRVRTIFNPQLVITDQRSRDIILNFLKLAHENGAEIQEIAVAGKEADWYESQFTNPKHQMKRISADQEIQTDCIIGEKAVYFLKYDNSEGAGIRIQREDLVMSMTTMFDLLWNSL
ncbi:MAG: sugar-specific transcriptional regulator TrmB [Oceanicoccus sp.]|jgi:sugar-specific transcriptional regulator TrmB